MPNRIKIIRKERGLTQTQLSELCSTSLQMIQYLENGQRQLTQKWMGVIAGALSVRPIDLLEDLSEQNNLQFSEIHEITVLGEVQAGVWSEAIYFDYSEQYTIPMMSKHKNAYALRVKGDSMNLFYRDGSHIAVVPIGEIPLKDQQKVVVQRKLKTGQIEATVKQLVIKNGTAELWPRSTNPKHQDPISIHWPYADGEKMKMETVEITGIVVGNYSEEEY